jgi:tight adherence protein B
MNVLVTAALILGILAAVGLGLTLTLRQVRQYRHDLERQLNLVVDADRNGQAPDRAAMMELKATGSLQILGRRLRGVFAIGQPRNWGMKAGAPALIAAAIAGAGVAWLAVRLGLHLSVWISAAAAVAAFFLAPRALLKHQQNVADKKFTEVFPDSIDMVIRMLRAGLPVTGAVRAVGDEAAPPVNAAFASLADQMAIGISFEDALATAGEHIGLADFRFFAVAVSLQRATGGNLAATLDILSDIMRKRRAMRLQAKATTGEVRMSAYVLGAIPFLIIGGLLVMTPDYLAPLISDRRGKIIIAIAVTSMLTGFGIIRQMMLSVTRAT